MVSVSLSLVFSSMGRLGRGSSLGLRGRSSGCLVLMGETYPLEVVMDERKDSLSSDEMPDGGGRRGNQRLQCQDSSRGCVRTYMDPQLTITLLPHSPPSLLALPLIFA